MNIDTPQPVKLKPTFYNICLMYDLDYPALQTIANMAHVDKSIIEAMFVSVTIHRLDAEKILTAFSAYTGKTWTFDDMKIALHPTFEKIYTTHHLDFVTLATDTDVPHATIDMMLSGEPVSASDARLVLQTVTKQTGHHYTLENVDIQLTENLD